MVRERDARAIGRMVSKWQLIVRNANGSISARQRSRGFVLEDSINRPTPCPICLAPFMIAALAGKQLTAERARSATTRLERS